MNPRHVIAALAALAVAAPAAGAAETIQPGMELVTELTPCTGSWIFDGAGTAAGRAFITTAAHCTTKVGERVTTADGGPLGRVVLRGEKRANGIDDVAFVEIDRSVLPRVSAAMRGHPTIPRSGYATPADTAAGDAIQISGFGLVFGELAEGREGRRGALVAHDRELIEYAGPTVFGDSGGPLAHVPSGRALAIVSSVCAGAPSIENNEPRLGCAGIYAPTVEAAIALAARGGLPLRLRTVDQPPPAPPQPPAEPAPARAPAPPPARPAPPAEPAPAPPPAASTASRSPRPAAKPRRKAAPKRARSRCRKKGKRRVCRRAVRKTASRRR